MAKTISTVMVAALVGTALLTGCGSSEQASSTDTKQAAQATPTEKTVNNVWGETKVKGTPQKVVALDWYIVDSMVALGVSPAGIAGTDKTRVPEYVKDQVKTFTDVGERKQPNLEIISSVQPDLIVANPERAKLIKGDLQNIATTIALSDKSYSTIMDDVDVLGDLLGKQAEAKKVRADLDAKMAAAKGKVKNNPSVLVVGVFGKQVSVWIKDSFVGSLMSNSGMNYAFDGAKSESEGKGDVANVTLERIAEINPDYLFFYGDDSKKLASNPLFQNMKAVKAKHDYFVDQNLWSRGRGPIAANLILDQALPTVTGEKSDLPVIGK